MPKFLMTREEMRDKLRKEYAAMLRALNAGEAVDKRRLKRLDTFLKGEVASDRHLDWQIAYDAVYRDAYQWNIAAEMTEAKAAKQAHLKAKKAVMDQYDISEQHVNRTVIKHD